jgi:hypothetical protein
LVSNQAPPVFTVRTQNAAVEVENSGISETLDHHAGFENAASRAIAVEMERAVAPDERGDADGVAHADEAALIDGHRAGAIVAEFDGAADGQARDIAGGARYIDDANAGALVADIETGGAARHTRSDVGAINDVEFAGASVARVDISAIPG